MDDYFSKKNEYGNNIYLEVGIVEDTCAKCNQEKACLYTDNSSGEYGSLSLCLDCIQTYFAKYSATQGNDK